MNEFGEETVVQYKKNNHTERKGTEQKTDYIRHSAQNMLRYIVK